MNEKYHQNISIFMEVITLAAMISSCSNPPSLESVDRSPTDIHTVEIQTHTPEPGFTSTFEPTLTATLELYEIKIYAFHDYNGNGQLDEEEPALEGIVNRTGNYECVTDAEGMCVLGMLSEGCYDLEIVDGRDVKKYEKMRHILKSISEFFIISKGMTLNVNRDDIINLPLSHGQFTLALPCDQDIVPFNYFDLDPTDGVRNYLGDTTLFMGELQRGTENGHKGLDFIGEGYPILAAAPGIVIGAGEDRFGGPGIKENKPFEKYIEIDHGVGSYPRISTYHHLASIDVKIGDFVNRGEIIGMGGRSGSSWPELHWDIWDGKKWDLVNHEFGTQIDPYRDLLNIDSISYWTVDNNPICVLSSSNTTE